MNAAVNLTGSANVDAPNCDIVSNSSSSQGINMTGSAQANIPCLVSAGNILTSGSAQYSLNKCASATTSAAIVTDPYASVPAPSIPGSCLSVPGGSSITLNPGYYCGDININGSMTATFNSGVYYVNGNLNISGDSTVTGANVTFYIKANHNVNISGQAKVTFSAPTSGTYSGIVFFGDRAGNSGVKNQFSGQSIVSITGAFYFPTQNVTFSGASTSGSNCMQIVADNVTISGQANLNSSCVGTGVANINVADGAPGSVKIVE